MANVYTKINHSVHPTEDWNLDGVDFFFSGPQEGQWWRAYDGGDSLVKPGNSATYHYTVIKSLRKKYMTGKDKTISYTTTHDVDFNCEDEHWVPTCGTIMNTVISATHPYLDFISFKVHFQLSHTVQHQIQLVF